MRLTVECGGRPFDVVIERRGDVYLVTVGDRRYTVDAVEPEPSTLSVLIAGRSYEIGFDPSTVPGVAPSQSRGERSDGEADSHGRAHYVVHLHGGTVRTSVLGAGAGGRGAGRAAGRRHAGAATLVSPMPGKVVRVLARVGDRVAERDGLVVVEAMKMENELRAPKAGTVREILVREGLSVEAGRALVVVE